MTDALDGRTAMVTGAGRGIGRGIALELAREGADVVAVDTDSLGSAHNQYGDTEIGGHEAARELEAEIDALGRRSVAYDCDVSDAAAVEGTVEAAIDEFDGIDVLVNNAGIITAGFLGELEEAEWDAVIDVNLKGPFLVSRAVVPHMIDREGGAIVNVSSIAGRMGFGGLAHYCASKWGVLGLTETMAAELARFSITVNAICPGVVETAMWENVLTPFIDRPYEENVDSLIPLGRDQSVEEMGELAVYFASNPNVTGQAVAVDGGALL